MKKASKYQPIFAVYWLQCRFSTYFLPDWLLQFCIYFDFPYCFLFVTYTAKFPVCFFLIFLKDFDFVTQSVVFFLKDLKIFCLFCGQTFRFGLCFCCLGYKFWSRDLPEPHQEQGREESQQQGNSISQVPEINQAPQRKEQQEEELDQPGKEAGVLEWVCKLQIHACVRDVFPLYFDTGVLGYPTGGFISCLCLFGSIRLSIRVCIFLIYIVLNYNYLF